MTQQRYNGTSVTRGPAMVKAGRENSMSLKPQTPDWKTVHRKFSKSVSQTHFEVEAKLTKTNTCAIIFIRQDQAPRLPSRWKCTHRLTLSGGSGTVRIRERRSRDPQSVKVFESIAGRCSCTKGMQADVRVSLADALPVLALCGKKVQINWQVFADDRR